MHEPLVSSVSVILKLVFSTAFYKERIVYIVVCECWICMTITAVHVVSECWAINKADLQRIDALDHWCLYKESLVFVGMILSEMLTFVIWPISHHSHPSSSLVVFLSLGILQEWMRMQTPAKSFLSLLLRAGDVHLGGHILPSWRPSKTISLSCIWSCMKPENWLRIDLSVWKLMPLCSAVHF